MAVAVVVEVEVVVVVEAAAVSLQLPIHLRHQKAKRQLWPSPAATHAHLATHLQVQAPTKGQPWIL